MTKWNKWKTLFCLPWINWWSTASAAVLNWLGGCLTMKRASPFINSATRPCDRAPLPSCERQKRGSRDTPSKDDSVMTSSKHQDSLSIFFFHRRLFLSYRILSTFDSFHSSHGEGSFCCGIHVLGAKRWRDDFVVLLCRCWTIVWIRSRVEPVYFSNFPFVWRVIVTKYFNVNTHTHTNSAKNKLNIEVFKWGKNELIFVVKLKIISFKFRLFQVLLATLYFLPFQFVFFLRFFLFFCSLFFCTSTCSA